MLKLRYADYKGVFHGFVLKEGYFYGQDTETGEYLAASGYESEGSLKVYRLQDGQWNPGWVNESNTEFDLIGVDDRFSSNRMTFGEWMVSKGYEEDAWKELDKEKFADLAREYDFYYLFDGLPEFVIEWMKIHSAEYKRKLTTCDEYFIKQYLTHA